MQDELTQILQQQLHDVHSPETISWWPLAIGWWLVIIAVFLTIALIVFYLLKQSRKNRYRKQGLSELNHLYEHWNVDQDHHAYLQAAAPLLKRCVMHISNEANLASMSGSQWLGVLERYSTTPLSSATSKALTQDLYSANSDIDIVTLHIELKHWLTEHKQSNAKIAFSEADNA